MCVHTCVGVLNQRKGPPAFGRGQNGHVSSPEFKHQKPSKHDISKLKVESMNTFHAWHAHGLGQKINPVVLQVKGYLRSSEVNLGKPWHLIVNTISQDRKDRLFSCLAC